MVSGQRKDASGNVVPRKIINKFTAAFNGKTVFEADWNPAISANPYQSFFYKAAETGEFTFTCKDDDASDSFATTKLTFASRLFQPVGTFRPPPTILTIFPPS